MMTAALITAVFSFMDTGVLIDALKTMTWPVVVLCVAAEVIYYGVESIRIHFLTHGRYGVWLIFKTRMASVFAGNLLPGVAGSEALRWLMLERAVSGFKVRLALELMASRLFGLIALLLMAVHPVGERLGGYGIEALLLAIVIILFCFFANDSHQGRSIRLFAVRSFRQLNSKGIRKVARTIYLSLQVATEWRVGLIALITSVITTFIAIGEFYWFGKALGAEVSFNQWMWLVPLSAVATFLPLGVGAVGTQDAALLIAAKALSIPVEGVIATSVSIHVLRILGTIPGAVFWLLPSSQVTGNRVNS